MQLKNNLRYIARNVRPSRPHKRDVIDATVWLHCQSRAVPDVRVPICRDSSHFGFSFVLPTFIHSSTPAANLLFSAG